MIYLTKRGISEEIIAELEFKKFAITHENGQFVNTMGVKYEGNLYSEERINQFYVSKAKVKNIIQSIIKRYEENNIKDIDEAMIVLSEEMEL